MTKPAPYLSISTLAAENDLRLSRLVTSLYQPEKPKWPLDWAGKTRGLSISTLEAKMTTWMSRLVTSLSDNLRGKNDLLTEPARGLSISTLEAKMTSWLSRLVTSLSQP